MKNNNLDLENIINVKIKLRHLLIPFFILKSYFLFDFLRTKAARIPNFIDEYISLASNYSFFTTLDFNAGEFIGGSYSIFLTSGPISAVGGVIGWAITNSFIFARIANFYWLYILQLFFAILIAKKLKKNYKFIFFYSAFSIVLTPWWQGSLYMIGEIASVIIFTNAIFLFSHYRNLSMFLFSLSIFFGKLITLLPFIVFYIVILIMDRRLSNLLKDVIFFLIPMSIWLLLVNFNYSYGNAYDYILDLIDFTLGHQSSGLANTGPSSIFSGEVTSWNKYDYFRLLIAPIIFLIILINNKESINLLFGKVTIPIALSTITIFFWFWFLNPTKWMRYSQHYSLLILICLFYLIDFEILKSNLYLIISSFLVLGFIDSFKLLIPLGVFLISYVVLFQKNYEVNDLVKFTLGFILFLSITIPFFQKETFGNLNEIIFECENNLLSEECLISYEANK